MKSKEERSKQGEKIENSYPLMVKSYMFCSLFFVLFLGFITSCSEAFISLSGLRPSKLELVTDPEKGWIFMDFPTESLGKNGALLFWVDLVWWVLKII